jgi:hypothetical protein
MHNRRQKKFRRFSGLFNSLFDGAWRGFHHEILPLAELAELPGSTAGLRRIGVLKIYALVDGRRCGD